MVIRVTAVEADGQRYILLAEEVPERHWGSVLVRVQDESEEVGRVGMCYEISEQGERQNLAVICRHSV